MDVPKAGHSIHIPLRAEEALRLAFQVTGVTPTAPKKKVKNTK
jgi:hypothetical protein